MALYLFSDNDSILCVGHVWRDHRCGFGQGLSLHDAARSLRQKVSIPLYLLLSSLFLMVLFSVSAVNVLLDMHLLEDEQVGIFLTPLPSPSSHLRSSAVLCSTRS
jgi:hypothetical protein